MDMFLKKRREDGLKVLTEKEIQQKLYGHYRPHVVAVEEEKSAPAVAVEEQPKKLERDLFVPPAELSAKKEPVFKPRPVPAVRKERHFFRNFGGTMKKTFVSAAHKVSSISLPRIPAMKKPRWVEKVESLPLGSVAAAFFAAVLLVVGIRATMHLGFNAWPIERILQAHKSAKPAEVSESEEKSIEENISVKVFRAPPVKLEAEKPLPAAVPIPTAKKFYTIQLVVYEDVTLAARQVAQLREKKLEAFYKSVKTSRGRQRYQVFAGRFDSFETAQTHLSRYKKANLLNEFKDSFVRPQTE